MPDDCKAITTHWARVFPARCFLLLFFLFLPFRRFEVFFFLPALGIITKVGTVMA